MSLLAGIFAGMASTASAGAAPKLLTPSSGVNIKFPTQPLVFSWGKVRNASTYRVQIDDNSAFNSPAVYETSRNSFTPTEPQTARQLWYWRVQAALTNGKSSSWAPYRTYTIQWADTPTLLTPENGSTVEDLHFSWSAIPGAASYQVQVSPNGDWANNLVLDSTSKVPHYYVPGVLNNASYFWRVRARDVGGNLGNWSTEWQFTRSWTSPKPTLLGPIDETVGDTKDVTFTWTPVRRASRYELQVSTDANFSPNFTAGCLTDHATFTPYASCDPVGTEGLNYWRVRAIDDSGFNGRVNSQYSLARSFTYDKREYGADASYPVVQLQSPADCTNVSTCAAVTDTPTFTWEPVDDVYYYMIYMAMDPSFTNIVKEYSTRYTTFTPAESLLDNQAGQAYYWFVRPCGTDFKCGAFDETVFDNAYAFKKRSLAVQTLSPAPDAKVANFVKFEWKDFLETNQGAATPSDQEAMRYRLQVSQRRDFTTLVEDAWSEETTYISSGTTYPEGPLFWRVQAQDGSSNMLTTSEISKLVKASSKVELKLPANGADSRGGPKFFSWKATTFAARYELEIYLNGDLRFSPNNRAVAVNTAMTAWAQGSNYTPGKYAWRVRRLDPNGNPGPWSAGRRFVVK
jgi:hypothetical protein